MCYILCKIDPMYCTLIWEKRGSGGCLAPPIQKVWGFRGRSPLRKKNWYVFWQFFASIFLRVFRHMVFFNGFLILVKELGLFTNLGQWIPQRVEFYVSLQRIFPSSAWLNRKRFLIPHPPKFFGLAKIDHLTNGIPSCSRLPDHKN
jgi:hypothetical protein